MTEIKDILNKYSRKLEGEIEEEQDISEIGSQVSGEFIQFKKDMMPNLSRYEKLCQRLGNIIKIKVTKKDEERIQEQLKIAHLESTPSQTLTLSILALFITFLAGLLVSIAVYLIASDSGIAVVMFFLFLVSSLFLFYYSYTAPFRLANAWRLKASSQMVPCILYVVAYMKHTSNLENAVAFASSHLEAPLSLDFKKIFWDVETGRYSTVRESLDSYLEGWRDYAPEFVESFHLIESSLYETSESRRVQVLERALQVILDGVYEKMLKYTHSIRSPLTNLYMLGIVLPTLGLALLPLASTLLGGLIRWYHVIVIFNLIIPFFVFYMTSQVMLRRPGGYGEASVLEKNPLYYKFEDKRAYLKSFLIAFPLFLIGLIPFIFRTGIFGAKDYTLSQLGIDFLGETSLFGFSDIGTGPFGILSVILSLFIPLSIALFFAIAYKQKTKEIIKARDQTKFLEEEFASSLFQLGNRLGDGMPAELAFGRVAESSTGTKAGSFFKIVNQNINQLGMSLETAIFNKNNGAIIYYPSALIATSMKILIEAVKKGLQVAANSLMSISEYVKNIHKINERLRDLLAEVVSDMKSNMTFLAPLLAGIVVGLSSMITLILSRLDIMFQAQGNQEIAGIGSIEGILDIFKLKLMIPPYFLQIAIGIYLIEIIFILTSTLVIVDSGEDRLKKIYDIASNLRTGILLYIITALASIIALSVIAAIALGGVGS